MKHCLLPAPAFVRASRRFLKNTPRRRTTWRRSCNVWRPTRLPRRCAPTNSKARWRVRGRPAEVTIFASCFAWRNTKASQPLSLKPSALTTRSIDRTNSFGRRGEFNAKSPRRGENWKALRVSGPLRLGVKISSRRDRYGLPESNRSFPSAATPPQTKLNSPRWPRRFTHSTRAWKTFLSGWPSSWTASRFGEMRGIVNSCFA